MEEIMARKDSASKKPAASRMMRNAPIPSVGEPLDGRHYLDVIEEQQYAGKPFVPHEQDIALKQGRDEENTREK
jgi:hypothetical protein